MKIYINFITIFIALLFFSCKKSKPLEDKILIEKTEISNIKKKYSIPSNLKIEKQEEVNIDNDISTEFIITAVNEDATRTYEFWYKNDRLIYEFNYPWVSINKKLLVNLDNDDDKEIVRIQGYEDGVDYVIYDISKQQQIPILYFNPVLEDNRFLNQYMWVYPNDITGLIINQNKEIRVSLNNEYKRDDNHIEPKSQTELPFIFFKGQTSQPEMKLPNINKPNFESVQSVINKIQKSIKIDDNLSKKTSILNKWQNDNIEIHITSNSITYLFHGQCIYAFPVKILNNNEVELIWGETGMDCVFDIQFNKTFGLSKEKIPQKGKPFAKYTLKKDVVNVTYYYKEWVNLYKEKINVKSFMDVLYVKEE
jgi:hypothetical protein